MPVCVTSWSFLQSLPWHCVAKIIRFPSNPLIGRYGQFIIQLGARCYDTIKILFYNTMASYSNYVMGGEGSWEGIFSRMKP